MIVFDLRCRAAGHVFEAWFASSEDYDAQAARGLVACPLCGDVAVEKALMAPRLVGKGTAEATTEASVGGTPGPDAAGMKEMLTALARAQSKALEGSTWVGTRFAEEARAMHAGDAEEKPIHGQATAAAARKLVDDGVPVAPLPLPVRPPGSEH